MVWTDCFARRLAVQSSRSAVGEGSHIVTGCVRASYVSLCALISSTSSRIIAPCNLFLQKPAGRSRRSESARFMWFLEPGESACCGRRWAPGRQGQAGAPATCVTHRGSSSGVLCVKAHYLSLHCVPCTRLRCHSKAAVVISFLESGGGACCGRRWAPGRQGQAGAPATCAVPSRFQSGVLRVEPPCIS